MADNHARKGPCLLPSMLPYGNNVSFTDSSFFTKGNSRLPDPTEVRNAASGKKQLGRPDPVVLPSLNLLVKYGREITVAEGQCLWAIQRLLPTVPVPEVYGWCQDNGETFIYMQLIEGSTLEQAWPDLEIDDKYKICVQLHDIINDLRDLRQDPNNPYIGNINQQPLQDINFAGSQNAGPFADVVSFNDWFSSLSNPADLHRSNIMMTWDEHGSPRVVGIIDWHQ